MASWKRTVNVKYGVVIYNYDGSVPYGLRLTIGDSVQVYEECNGWYRGCVLRNKAVKGIFPASYICAKECTVENAGTQFEAIYPKEDPFVKELTSVLREWAFMWKQKYIKNEKQLFVALRHIMWDLVEYRQRFLSGTLSQDQINDLKEKAVMKIDWGNCKLDLDLVPRIDGEVVSADSTSVVELYKVHVQSAEASGSLTGRGSIRRQPKPHKSTVCHHLYFNMTNFVCNMEEPCEVFFSIYESREGKFISERFLVNIRKEGDSGQKMNEKISNSTAVFTTQTDQIQQLQYVQNSAARLLTRTLKQGRNNSPILKELHWLHVPERIRFKTLLMTIKCVNQLVPTYLSDLLIVCKPIQERCARLIKVY